MPIYEFRCTACGSVREAMRKVDEGPEGLACNRCGSEQLERRHSTYATRVAGGSGSTAATNCRNAGFS